MVDSAVVKDPKRPIDSGNQSREEKKPCAYRLIKKRKTTIQGIVLEKKTKRFREPETEKKRLIQGINQDRSEKIKRFRKENREEIDYSKEQE